MNLENAEISLEDVGKVDVLDTHLTLPSLGLDDHIYRSVSTSVTQIIHSA